MEQSTTISKIKGVYYILYKGVRLTETYKTNAQAWKALDRMLDDPHNSKETRQAWSQHQHWYS